MLFAMLASFSGFSQSTTATKTDVNKDIDVVKVYEQVVREGYGTPDIYKKLANGYYFQGDYTNAKKWFETLFEAQETDDKMLLFRYKQTLKALNISFDSKKYLSVSDG